MKAETKITQDIIKWMKGTGGDAWHVHGSAVQRAGEPDIDGWVKHEEEFIPCKFEVKTTEGVPTPLQLHRLAHYSYGGYCVGVVTSKLEVMRCLAEYEVLKLWDTPRSRSFLTGWMKTKQEKTLRGKGWLHGWE